MPKVGQIVIYRQPKKERKYGRHHPAIVTRVWSDEDVNLKVFIDCGPIEDRASVVHGKGPGLWDYD